MAERPKKYVKKQTVGEKVIKLAKDRYTRARTAQNDENKRFRDNMRFTYDSDSQWPSEIRTQRNLDDRPIITVNRFPVFVRSIVNNYKQNPSGIKVLPADDGADKEVAEIFNGLIKNIEAQSGATQIKGYALGTAVAGNKGFFRISTKYIEGSFDQQEIIMLPVTDPQCVTYDCDDTSLDGSGWKWLLIEDWLSEEEFESRFPDEDLTSWPSSNDGDSWVKDSGKTIRIAEYFYKEMEKVNLCLLDTGESVYEDELQDGMNVVDTRIADRPIVRWCILGGNATEPLEVKEWAGSFIPFVPVWGDCQYIEGKKMLYSALEYSHDAQRLMNFGASTEAELVGIQNKAPYMVTPQQIQGFQNDWAAANSENMPYILYNHVNGVPAPMRQGFASPPGAVLQLSQSAAVALMDTSGIREASLGQVSNETSGRAIDARAAQGDNATFQFHDNMAHADRYAGMILVDLIPKIYDTARVVRVLGLDGSESMKAVNQEVEEKDDWGQAIIKFYDLSAGKYDVVPTSGASFNTKRKEGAELLTQMMQGNPQLMQQAGDIIFKALDIPYAEEMAERLTKFLPPGIAPKDDSEQQMPPEVQQQIQGYEQQIQEMQAQMEQMNAAAMDKQGQMAIEQQKVQIQQFDAETKRMSAMQSAQPQVTATAEIPHDDARDLTEADKLEIEIEKAIRLKEMDHEHQASMKKMEHKMARMKDNEMAQLDGDMQEKPTALAISMEALLKNQEVLTAQIAQTTQQIADMAAIAAAPKRVLRDASGRPVGIESVI
jgi:hypothetical protein